MLRRLSVHAAGLHEDRDTYVWENLDASTFDSGAAAGLKKVEKVQREYAIAGTLIRPPRGSGVARSCLWREAECAQSGQGPFDFACRGREQNGSPAWSARK